MVEIYQKETLKVHLLQELELETLASAVWQMQLKTKVSLLARKVANLLSKKNPRRMTTALRQAPQSLRKKKRPRKV